MKTRKKSAHSVVSTNIETSPPPKPFLLGQLFTTARTFWCLLVLAILNLGTFHLHYSGKVSFPYDFPQAYYAFVAYWTTSLQHGEWPHWIPYQSMGYPAALNPQLGLYYPPFWFFVLPRVPYTLYAANIVQILHVLFASIGCFFLARRMFRSDAIALCGGIACALFGGFYSNSEHADIIRAYAWVPWVFFGLLVKPKAHLHRFLRWEFATHLEFRNLLLPLSIYCLITGGYPGVMFAVCFMSLIYICTQAVCLKGASSAVNAARDALILCALVATGLALASVYLIPTAYLSHELARSQATVPNDSRAFLQVRMLYNLLVPSPFFTNDDYSMYAMQIPIVLLAFLPALTFRRIPMLLPMLVTGGIAVVMAFRELTPVSDFICLLLPPLRISRFPAGDYRLFIYLALLMACLAAIRNLSETAVDVWRSVGAMGAGLLVVLAGVMIFRISLPLTINTQAFAKWLLFEVAVCAAVVLMFAVVRIRHWNTELWIAGTAFSCAILMVPGIWFMQAFFADPGVPVYYKLMRPDGQLRFHSAFEKSETNRPPRVTPVGAELPWRGYIDGIYFTTDKISNFSAAQQKIVNDPVLLDFALKPSLLIRYDCSPTTNCALPQLNDLPLTAESGGRTVSYKRNVIQYAVNLPTQSLVIENELFADGWSAICQIHGEQLSPIRVDGVFRGWVLGQGNHQLTMRYQTPYLLIAAMASAVTLAAWLFLCFQWRRSASH